MADASGYLQVNHSLNSAMQCSSQMVKDDMPYIAGA